MTAIQEGIEAFKFLTTGTFNKLIRFHQYPVFGVFLLRTKLFEAFHVYQLFTSLKCLPVIFHVYLYTKLYPNLREGCDKRYFMRSYNLPTNIA